MKKIWLPAAGLNQQLFLTHFKIHLFLPLAQVPGLRPA